MALSLLISQKNAYAQCQDINVVVCIDGRSILEVLDNQLRWNHIDFSPPGQHGSCPGANYIYINGVQWTNWQAPFTLNFAAGCYDLTNFQLTSCRDQCNTINTTPTPGQWRPIFDFNDNGPGGAAVYNATLTFCPSPLPPVTVSASSNAPICDGETLQLNATSTPANITYSWAGPNGFTASTNNPSIPNATIAATGTYNITADDGCTTATDNITVNVNPTPQQTLATVDPTCNGFTDGSIVSIPGVPNSNYTYSWSNGPNTAANNNIGAGTYNVTITDPSNGCTLQDGATLTEPPVLTATISSTDILCFGNSTGAADLTVGGGTSPYSYLWSNGSTMEDLNTIPAGNYNVTVTDANQCVETAGIAINQASEMQSIINVTPSECFGDANGQADLFVSGGTPGYTYLWSNGETNQDLINLTNGSFTVTVTDANNCTLTDDFTIAEPGQLTVSFTTEDVSCNGGNDGRATANVAGGSAPINYLWSAGGSDSIASNLGPGTYAITLIDNNGCSTTGNTTINQPPALVVTYVVTEPVCYGYDDGGIILTVAGGTGNPTFTWADGSVDNNLTDIPAGVYPVTVTDENGCTFTDNILVDQPDSSWVRIRPDSSAIYLGETQELTTTVFSNAPDSAYYWSPAEYVDCDTCANVNAMPIDSTIYTVIMIDEDGCTATGTAVITIKEPKILFIPNAFSPNGDSNNDVFYVYSKGVKDFYLRIFDRWGEMVFEGTDIASGWNGSFHGKVLEPDVYIYDTQLIYLDNELIKRKGSFVLLR